MEKIEEDKKIIELELIGIYFVKCIIAVSAILYMVLMHVCSS